jgi:fructose-specific phosphotransferase system IIA component
MDEEPLLLSSLLPPENIVIPLCSATKEEVVEELVDLLVSRGSIVSKDDTLRMLWEREKLMSTGIGYGVAIPHILSEHVKEPAAALGLQPCGVDYASLDGKPATLVFLLISPKSDDSPHIRILAHLSRVFRHESVREKLLSCTSTHEAARVIRDAELLYGQGES